MRLFVALCVSSNANADNGSRLWLNFKPLPAPVVNTYRERIKTIAVYGGSATFNVLRAELADGCTGLLGTGITVTDRDDASIVVGTPQTSALIRKLRWDSELERLGPEGFRIRTIRNGIVIASMTDT